MKENMLRNAIIFMSLFIMPFTSFASDEIEDIDNLETVFSDVLKVAPLLQASGSDGVDTNPFEEVVIKIWCSDGSIVKIPEIYNLNGLELEGLPEVKDSKLNYLSAKAPYCFSNESLSRQDQLKFIKACFDSEEQFCSLKLYQIIYPENKKKYSAIVLASGTGGIGDWEHHYARWFSQQGFLVILYDTNSNCIVLDKDGKKTKRGGALDQLTSPLENDISGAYVAYQLLRSDPKVDKIGICGPSRGGLVALDFSINYGSLSEKWKGFDFHIVMSGTVLCVPGNAKETVVNAPLFFAHGEQDDYTRYPLINYVYEKVNPYIDVCELHTYPGYHMFDAPKPQYGFWDYMKYIFCCGIMKSNKRTVQLLNDCMVETELENEKIEGFYPLNLKKEKVNLNSTLREWGGWDSHIRDRVKVGKITAQINEKSASLVKEDLLKFLKKIGAVVYK